MHRADLLPRSRPGAFVASWLPSKACRPCTVARCTPVAPSGAMPRLAARHQCEHDDDGKEGEAAPDGRGHDAMAPWRLDPRIAFLTCEGDAAQPLAVGDEQDLPAPAVDRVAVDDACSGSRRPSAMSLIV